MCFDISPTPDHDTAHRRLLTSYESAVTADVAEVTPVTTTIDAWQPEVLACFETSSSNAPAESTDVKVQSDHPSGPPLPPRWQRRRADPVPGRSSRRLPDHHEDQAHRFTTAA